MSSPYLSYFGKKQCCELRIDGPIGPVGLTGPTGLRGNVGITGLIGPMGPTGRNCTGPTGPTGPTGETGPQGANDVYIAQRWNDVGTVEAFTLESINDISRPIIVASLPLPVGSYLLNADFMYQSISTSPDPYGLVCFFQGDLSFTSIVRGSHFRISGIPPTEQRSTTSGHLSNTIEITSTDSSGFVQVNLKCYLRPENQGILNSSVAATIGSIQFTAVPATFHRTPSPIGNTSVGGGTGSNWSN